MDEPSICAQAGKPNPPNGVFGREVDHWRRLLEVGLHPAVPRTEVTFRWPPILRRSRRERRYRGRGHATVPIQAPASRRQPGIWRVVPLASATRAKAGTRRRFGDDDVPLGCFEGGIGDTSVNSMARNAGLGGLGIYAKLGVGDRAAAVAQVLRTA
jgi:hypothetical protein